jgi:hypothetical protein
MFVVEVVGIDISRRAHSTSGWIMRIIKGNDYSFEVHDRTEYSKQMENLVRVAPNVKSTWSPTLWYAGLDFVSDLECINVHRV